MNEINSKQLSAWRFIVWFGIVSLFADFVYEGARAVTGPFMAHLGASAVVVGVVTGAGEALALAGRLVTGPMVDRTRAYWPLAIFRLRINHHISAVARSCNNSARSIRINYYRTGR